MRRSTSTVLHALLIAVLALGFASCGWEPQLSLSPLYTHKELVQDDTILGTWNPRHDPFFEPTDRWVGDTDEYTVTKSDAGYILTRDLGPAERPPIASELYLVRLGKYLFVDIATPRWSLSRDRGRLRLSYPSLRAHAIARITVTRNVLIVRMMETEKIKELAAANKFRLKQAAAEVARGESVLTSSTIELQKVALEHANDRELFSQPFVLCRKGADCELEVPREEFTHDPRNASAGGRLAIAYMRRGRFNDAWRTWKHMPKLKSDPTARGQLYERLQLARAFIDWGYIDSGLAVLRAGVDAFPKNSAAWFGLAFGDLYANRPQHALAAVRTAFEIGDEKDQAFKHFFAWLVYFQMGEFENARNEAIQSGNRTLFTALADFASGRYDAAYAEFQKLPHTSRGLLPGTSALLRYRLDGRTALNKEDEGDLAIAWALDLFDSREFRVRCLARFLRGDIGESQFLEQFHPRKGQFVQPELCVGYYFAGEKYLIDGDLKKARDYFQKAVDSHASGYFEWMVANARLKQLKAPDKRPDLRAQGPDS